MPIAILIRTARVFEVGLPTTQAWKRGRLQSAGIAVAQSLVLASVDFERQTLAGRLEPSGFNRKLPAGTGIAFDFAVDPKLLGWPEGVALCALSRRVAAAGEPFQLFFRPAELAEELKHLGVHRIEILGAEEIQRPLFHRSHGRTAHPRWLRPASVCLGLKCSSQRIDSL